LLRRLLDGGNSIVAGRLIGAFRRVGRIDIADEIRAAMVGAGYAIREADPFVPGHEFGRLAPAVVPIVGRIHSLWDSLRGTVLRAFPHAPGLPKESKAYLHFVDEIYQSDAYHSLSIEGYRVTPALIERVRSASWNPNSSETDRQNRDALAARGYWQAFQQVKRNVEEILGGANPGALIRNAHRDWCRELFQPSVAPGIIPPTALAGYRNDFAFLRTSRYVPPRWEAVRDAMPVLFDLTGGIGEIDNQPADANQMRLLVGFDHRAIGVKIPIKSALIVVYALGIVEADDRSDLGSESLGGVECCELAIAGVFSHVFALDWGVTRGEKKRD
jgi:hypothetical protein